MVIKWNKELEEVLNTVNGHLVNACEIITKDGALFKNNDNMYYTQCMCITVYNLIGDVLDEVDEFAIDNRYNPIDMKQLGVLLFKLIVLESMTEEYRKELIAMGVACEEVLNEIYRCSEPLQKFVRRLIPPVEQ